MNTKKRLDTGWITVEGATPVANYRVGSVIQRYCNRANGVESIITKHAKGYAVSVRDTDAAEMLGTAVIFPDFERADIMAVKCVRD